MRAERLRRLPMRNAEAVLRLEGSVGRAFLAHHVVFF